MKYIIYDYLMFVPDKLVKNGIPNTICVYTKKFNNKIYKRKMVQLGIIKKVGREYCFSPLQHYQKTNLFLRAYTINIIFGFLTNLNNKKIIFDTKKGIIPE